MQNNFHVNPVSTHSGLPCTFFGGMQAAANGCVQAALSGPTLANCVKGAFAENAMHTAGCVGKNPIPPDVYPTPKPN